MVAYGPHLGFPSAPSSFHSLSHGASHKPTHFANPCLAASARHAQMPRPAFPFLLATLATVPSAPIRDRYALIPAADLKRWGMRGGGTRLWPERAASAGHLGGTRGKRPGRRPRGHAAVGGGAVRGHVHGRAGGRARALGVVAGRAGAGPRGRADAGLARVVSCSGSATSSGSGSSNSSSRRGSSSRSGSSSSRSGGCSG